MECLIEMALFWIFKLFQRLKNKKNNMDSLDRSPETTDESSFEMDDSFQAMIERKRNEAIAAKKALEVEDVSQEISAISRFSGGGDADNRCLNESTFIEQDSMCKTTDESFEEMERLCSMHRQTMSYGGSTSLRQEEEEEAAIRRILESSGKGKSSSEMPPPESTIPLKRAVKQSQANVSLGVADITQLDDVEEPSGMWEHSILDGACQAAKSALSPVKRMHLLRPSTIIEEATMMNETGATSKSVNTSLESYATAKQNLHEDDDCSIVSGSEVYRTAEEGEYSKGSVVSSTAESSVGFDSTIDKTALEMSCRNEIAHVVVDDDDDCVIILSSSEDEEGDYSSDPLKINEKTEDPLKIEETSELLETSLSLEENSLCQDSLEDPSSPLLDAIPDHFNDTMEEMDFMMRQGMKIMQQKAQQQQQQQSETSKSSVQAKPSILKKPLYVPQMTNRTPATPVDRANKTSSAQKPSSAPSTGDTGSFKKPICRFPLPKSAKKFDHIVSPIGTYIKNTAQPTLQARIFCPNQNLIDVFGSNKNDNRGSSMSIKENFTQPPAHYSSSLPRKGVVSSRGAHVLDERNAVRVPGGDKVHRLLSDSPTLVIRHEGRLRYQRETQLTDDSVVADTSMADLSMASGDVSVRVVKDVRRF
ncbi:uncharacterized protein LOC129746145 isoform X2 [Uranotaenia lowii]|uniref:uncharacterized protein LOC129746145 isoform X2 n=1 Tax=Uranotaenia lowii TaxID=190385 RepID=UPI00247B14D8|nr:uncharacterized protein LOC129746145 isoform X2 [Uranotaenia lowii]